MAHTHTRWHHDSPRAGSSRDALTLPCLRPDQGSLRSNSKLKLQVANCRSAIQAPQVKRVLERAANLA
eukprot:5865-Heterococcus_DN1.PRE.4